MVVVFLLIFNYRALPKVVKPFIIRAELSRRPETGKAGKEGVKTGALAQHLLSALGLAPGSSASDAVTGCMPTNGLGGWGSTARAVPSSPLSIHPDYSH